MNDIFQHLFVLGRPAGGKSEFLDMLYGLSDEERAKRMHIGKMRVMDDFVWLWQKFEEDDIWEKLGYRRLHSKKMGRDYLLDDAVLFDFLIAKINREVVSNYLKDEDLYRDHTLIIEFARGGEAPYRPTLELFDQEVMRRAAILYVEVSHAESVRRNEARYQEKLRHSILAHRTPDHDMERFYSEDDWFDITGNRREGYITVDGIQVPFITLHNEPEIKDPQGLAYRYAPALTKLMGLRRELPNPRPV